MKLLLIKNADVYAPEHLGFRDVLVAGERIVKIDQHIDPTGSPLDMEILDAEGHQLLPGYVDQHVHIIGGGGESGPHSRTPEVMLSSVTSAGVTTLVGVLGTDGTTRHLESLLAKARALDTEGITAYMLTSSYELPPLSLTGSPRRDMILIDKVLGIGEVAISDHRSSEPTKEEIKRLLTQARVGGMLAGKAGVMQFHLGSAPTGLSMLRQIIEESAIPAKHIIPTHVNRAPALMEEAKELMRMGAYADITSGVRLEDGFEGGIAPREAIRQCYEEGLPMQQLTMSSDGNGCMSEVRPDGTTRLLVARLHSLHEEIMGAVALGVPMEAAVAVATANPAKANGLYPRKGALRVGSDADMLLLNQNAAIDTVLARGRVMVQHAKPVVFGTFENF